jgi:hypothetical protein
MELQKAIGRRARYRGPGATIHCRLHSHQWLKCLRTRQYRAWARRVQVLPKFIHMLKALELYRV